MNCELLVIDALLLGVQVIANISYLISKFSIFRRLLQSAFGNRYNIIIHYSIWIRLE